ncbi:aconitate hydratase AcnA [Ravibacter arvi]|uniref:Aconitate hydratase n=1 Tax=Ravibacter arvi TaxID=2051041 RepID=A0ABP8M635_9BACT
MLKSDIILGIKKNLNTRKGTYIYHSLPNLEQLGYDPEKLPFCIRILLENVLRNFDGFAITLQNIETLLRWHPETSADDTPFKPARVLMQDFTGVPSVVDLASLRAEIARRGKNPDQINPVIPVDLVVDHSVQVDYFGTGYSYKRNIEEEYNRNQERYQFLKWAQRSFSNFRVVPPGMGICHQVNLEYLSMVVIERNGEVFPDTLVGTDSHTPMVNGIGIVGWGVGGIEAEAAILGQPVYFTTPKVFGLRLTGRLPVGSTATDLVLTIAELLRKYGVTGAFIEVFGDGLDYLSVPDRATISNMSPEFGCTITYFPVDDKTLEYMRLSNRSEDQIQLVEDYCKANLMWRTGSEKIVYSDVIRIELSSVLPCVAGPKRPQDKISLKDLPAAFSDSLHQSFGRKYVKPQQLTQWFTEGGNSWRIDDPIQTSPVETPVEENGRRETKNVSLTTGQEKFTLSDGAVVLAAITSCTNTSNPYAMIGAGLLARKAREYGLDVKPWVKTSMAPGSRVVTQYLSKAGLLADLEALKFHIVGYGCTSCIGNSGPLPSYVSKVVEEYELVVAAVLSGNRNFEARIHPQVKMNFLMSPMLVVAYAIAGRIDIDLLEDPISYDPNHQPVYLKDICPTDDQIHEVMRNVLSTNNFADSYRTIFEGSKEWQELEVPNAKLYDWVPQSTYLKESPFFKDLPDLPHPLQGIQNARVLLVLGDSITTDHISPAGSYNEFSPAGKYLLERGVAKADFNSYGSRRGHDEVMKRGTFANVRLRNKLATREGGYTTHLPTRIEMTIYEASIEYQRLETPLIVLAGKEYGSGSSRDWAAKGTSLLGIKAIIAESYERIHRSNLVGMGILPLQYKPGENAESLGLTGEEQFTITGITKGIEPLHEVDVTVSRNSNRSNSFKAIARLDSKIEIEYYRNGGILQYVLRQFLTEL